MLRFYHGKVLTLQKSMEIQENYEVWVDNDTICYVGPELTKEQMAEKGRKGFEREIDLKGNLLMPGFKDAHTHSPMTFLRSYADDLPLQEWLYQQVFPMEAKLTPEHIYRFTRLAILEYLSSGITASFDMYVEPEANAQANIDMGFRTVLCGTLNDFKDSVPALENYYKTFNQYHTLISYQLGFHAEYTTGEPLLRDLAALAAQEQAPVYTHLSETAKEVAECRQRYGASPVKALADMGIWKYGGGGLPPAARGQRLPLRACVRRGYADYAGAWHICGYKSGKQCKAGKRNRTDCRVETAWYSVGNRNGRTGKQ